MSKFREQSAPGNAHIRQSVAYRYSKGRSYMAVVLHGFQEVIVDDMSSITAYW